MSARVAACGCIHRADGSVVVWCKRHAGQPVESKSPYRLWTQAHTERREKGESSHWADLRYRDLMVEAGHLIPGTPEPLPCGWPTPAVSPSGETEVGP